MTALSKLGQAALAYARKGWAVFPCERGGKAPLCEHGFKEASANEETIRAWWLRWPDANIGSPMGRYVVLDVDGPEGEDSLAELESRYGKLPETATVQTGNGRHLYFAPNGAVIGNSTAKLGPHLDIRAEGGYVILPPSIHSSGRKYQWLNKDKPALLPTWILGLLSEPSEERGESVTGKISQGQRNVQLASHAGSMRRRDMSASAIEAALLQENKLRCDPPLPESEVRRIAQSVGRYAPTKPGGPPPIPGVLASDVTPQSVAWLWPNHIPLGKVTLFDGDPDLAKSTVSLDLAARITRGLPMPDGTEPGCLPAGVVIVSLEDGIADTIRPRLEAAGAALEKVRIVSVIRGTDGVERTPTLPFDLPAIESAIQSVNAKLLVLDPLVAMLGAETNSYRDQDIRRVLAPVAALAEKTGVAVICIRHLNKGGGQNPKYRGGGSIGIIGAARAAFLFGEKPGEEGRYVFAPIKGNLWRGKPAALEYSVENQDGQPVIAWHGASSHNAASLLAQPENAEESNACGEAKAFLSEFLADGPHSVAEIKSEARRAGISDRTLIRARYQLGVRAKKVGFGNGQYWEWGLPKDANPPAKSANNEDLASFEQPNETMPDISTSLPKNAKTQNMAPFAAEEGNLRGRPEAPPGMPLADDTEVI